MSYNGHGNDQGLSRSNLSRSGTPVLSLVPADSNVIKTPAPGWSN